MTSLWIDRDHMAIRKYGVSGTGTKTVVKVEFEVTDPTTLGFFLRELAAAQKKVAEERAEKAGAAKPQRAIGQQRPLALPFHGSDGK